MKKIIITGGHFTPGLAIIPKLKQAGWKVYWAGEVQAGAKVKTLEARILPGLNVPFFNITAAKLSREAPLHLFLSFWKLPVGLVQSLAILLRIRPQAILSFGSYVSLPVVAAGFLLGIPIIVHEQTAASGLANRIAAKIARAVAISFASSFASFPKGRTHFTGNLIRKDFYAIAKKRKVKKPGNPQVIYATGGSRGSQAINRAVFSIIKTLSRQFLVYHQTGSLDFYRAKGIKNKLENSKNYVVQEVLTPEEVEEVFAKADMLVSRAGANTVSEIAVCGIPTIFIPLPRAESDEQTKNAQLLKNAGLAEILPQNKLSGEKLLAAIEKMAQNLTSYQKNGVKTQRLVPQNAADKLIRLIEHAQAWAL